MAKSDFTKPSAVKRVYVNDWRKHVVQAWRRSTEYIVDDIVRSPLGSGFYYKCTTAGISGGAIPDFKIEAAEIMQDGSVVWTVKDPAGAGLFTISTSVWIVDAGITVGPKAISGFYTSIELDGGTDGNQYRATNDIVLSNGAEYQDSMIIGIDDPDPL